MKIGKSLAYASGYYFHRLWVACSAMSDCAQNDGNSRSCSIRLKRYKKSFRSPHASRCEINPPAAHWHGRWYASRTGFARATRRRRRSFGRRRPRLRWRPRPGLSRGGGQSARRARPRRPPDETLPRPPARRPARVCRGAWPFLAAFGRFFMAPKATPEADLAVFWPFRAGFGPAAAAANSGPHGGGAHAARSSSAGGDSVPSVGRVCEAVFSWARERSIGIGHAFVSWRLAAEKVLRQGEPILPNIYVFVNI